MARKYGQARHKPRAVQRGSTTVTFEIGASGALGQVRVSQSSGNAWLDQMALHGPQFRAISPASQWRIDLHDPNRFPVVRQLKKAVLPPSHSIDLTGPLRCGHPRVSPALGPD
jgi:TonB family protein